MVLASSMQNAKAVLFMGTILSEQEAAKER
jgi:hypothetical protein